MNKIQTNKKDKKKFFFIIQESVHWVKYRRGENQLVVFADDTTPRPV